MSLFRLAISLLCTANVTITILRNVSVKTTVLHWVHLGDDKSDALRIIPLLAGSGVEDLSNALVGSLTYQPSLPTSDVNITVKKSSIESFCGSDLIFPDCQDFPRKLHR